MYLSFYNLKAKPFQITTDQKFFWFGKNHSDALAGLKDGVQNNNGFFLLIGETGTGKTTLINCLLKTLEPNFIIVKVPDPDFECLDFFNFLAESFQINNKFSSKGAFFVHFNFFLKNAYSANKKIFLIVDEAHRLKNDLLKELSVLSDIEINNRKMINILLVGQEGLNELIEQQGLREITKKITDRHSLKPLTEQETDEYIRHHLKSAGPKIKIFTSGAVREIYSFSKGNPVLINNICDRALLTGYSNGIKTINSAIIKECSDELEILKTENDKEDKKQKIFEKKVGEPISFRNAKLVWKSPIFAVLLLIIVFMAGYLTSNLESETTSYSSIEEAAHKKHKQMTQRIDRIVAEQSIESDKIENKSTPDTDKKNEVQAKQVSAFNFSDQKFIIYFKNNSNDLPNKAIEILDKILSSISQYPDSEIIIEGYSDSVGNYWYNKKLSKLRANVVKSYLVGRGIPQLKIKVFGQGPKNPLGSNKTAEGRTKNRRVEIKININEHV
jgi:general secretion pathway protein A